MKTKVARVAGLARSCYLQSRQARITILLCATITMLFLAFGTNASASILVTYRLDNVQFYDGDVASGTFTYDYSTLGNCCNFSVWVTDVNITLSPPPRQSGSHSGSECHL